MKDHIWEERRIDTPYMKDLGDYLAEVEAMGEGLVNPKVSSSYSWDETEFQVAGWRPMTERELEQASKRRAAARKANKAKREKKEAEERAEFERLARKYGEAAGA